MSGSSLRQSNPAEQVGVALVRAKRIQAGVGLEPNEPCISLLNCLLERCECSVLIAKARVEDGHLIRREIRVAISIAL